MTLIDDKTLRIERTYQAPADRVFAAWTNPEVMRRWWRVESNWETAEAEVDARVGGAVRVVMHNPDKDEDYGGGGVYTEVDPPRRLSFTWRWDWDTRSSLIEIDFEETDGATKVTFTHSGLFNKEIVLDHDDGWSKILDRLGRDLEAADGA